MPDPLQEMIAGAMGGPAPVGGQPAPQQPDPAAVQAQAQAAAKAAEQTPTPPTAGEKAATAGAPQTEDKLAQEEAILFDVDFGGQKRQLTPAQIKATFERYAALNHQHASMKPVMEVIKPLLDQGVPADKVAQMLMGSFKQQAEAPIGGKDTNPNPGPAQVNVDDFKYANMAPEEFDQSLSAWESENAVTMPPGYKEAAKIINGLTQQVASLTQMVQAMQAQQMGGLDAARDATQNAQVQQAEAIKRQIATNLDAVQQELGLPDEKAGEFMQFAQQRGYTLEDFVDKNMLLLVARDYANAMNSPEMERLRQMAERRNAIAGSLGPAPTGGGAGAGAAAPAAGGDPLAEMAAVAAQRRGANLL